MSRLSRLLFAIAVLTTLAWAANFITLSLSSNSMSFALAAGSGANPGNTNITATTTWSLAPPNTLNIYAYFASGAAALTDGAGHNIPSSAFYISANGGALQALTNTLPFGGANAGLQLELIDIGPRNKDGSINDVLAFNINLSALPQLPAGTYTGTLFIRSKATGPGGEDSGTQTIVVSATLSESLTVNLSSNSVAFTLSAGNASNPGNSTVTATTAWVLRANRNSVGLFAYFSSASSALSDGAGNNIPSSAFYISDNGAAFAPLSNTVPFGAAGAGTTLTTVGITSANENSSHTDALSFNIDLSGGTLPQLPASIYTGTLNIQAQATP